jgi:hypothetical protein
MGENPVPRRPEADLLDGLPRKVLVLTHLTDVAAPSMEFRAA